VGSYSLICQHLQNSNLKWQINDKNVNTINNLYACE